jgi:hypothetical protein
MTVTCAVEGCDISKIRARGWCDKHWQRWWNHGDPTFIKTGRGLPLEERFWRSVVKTETCWLWTAGKKPAGEYGVFNISKTHGIVAHRFAYQVLVGPIPDGMELDHKCEVKNCVNPDHLEPVTRVENMLRISVRRAQRTADLAIARTRIAELEEQLRVAHEEIARHNLASSIAGTRKGRGSMYLVPTSENPM